MKRKLVCGLIAVLIVLTAPWPFDATWSTDVLGLPPWAFYCLCMTVVLGVSVAILLQFAWGLFAGQDKHQDE